MNRNWKIDEEERKKDECTFDCTFIEYNTAAAKMIDHVPYKRLLSQIDSSRSSSSS